MPKQTHEQKMAAIAAQRAKIRADVGARAVQLHALQTKVEALPATPDGLAAKFDMNAKQAKEAHERLTELRRQLDAQMKDLNQRICLLDAALRYINDPNMRWDIKLAHVLAYMEAATSDPDKQEGRSPNEVWRMLDPATRTRNERFDYHDSFVRGWGHVTAGYVRLIGSHTGATDLITVSYGIDDTGKSVGAPKRVAAFLGLVGGALLSDAATSWHLQNIVTDAASRAARNKVKTAVKEGIRKKGSAPDGLDVATSQTSTKASGTIADIEAMGIPVENFDKIQARCREQNTQSLIRPSGVETPDHLRAGAEPKGMHHKTKTANDYDGLIGSDPTMNGAAAGFDPKTDFFEGTIRSAGMSDADIAAGVDALKAGKIPDAPPGFADEGLWNGAAKRFHHRQSEWNGATGDALRKRVADGDSEIRNGIIFDKVDGEMRPVTGDHDLFETFVNGRAATSAEADAFWKQLEADGAGVKHGGHARFDPKPEDYQPGGRFEVDTTGYSPEAAAAKIKAKYESDRNIYEVIIDKHSHQGLPDHVLARMEGFVPPSRAHYPEGAYGDLRFKQDQDLFERWEFMQSGAAGPLPQRRPEVLVLINPFGPPLIIRAGDLPANFTAPRPTGFREIVPGSGVKLPTGMLFFSATGAIHRSVLEWDDLTIDWFDRFAALTDAAAPECVDNKILAEPPWEFPWKRVAAATVGIAVVGGGVLAFAGGGDDEAAAPATTALSAVVAPSPVTTPPTATPPTAAPSTVPDPTSPPSNVPDPTAPPSTLAAAVVPPSTVPVATRFGFVNPCGVVTHGSSSSRITTSGVVAGVDGVVPAGSTVAFVADGGSDVLIGEVAPNGVVGGVDHDIFSFGNYGFDVLVNDTPVEFGSPFNVQVGDAEGPVDGCVPASDLTDGQLDDVFAGMPGVFVDAGGQAGSPGGGTPGGGLNAQIPDSFPAPEDDLGPYREFFTRFETAHREGDVDFLLSKLHPATIARYGEAQCGAYVDSIVGTVSDMRVISGTTEPWDFPLDGGSTEIAGSVTLQIDANWDGAELIADVHVSPVDGDFGWFADCGEPL